MGFYPWSRSAALLLVTFSGAVLPGCFLFNRGDAIDERTQDTVRNLSSQMEKQSSLSRSSGQATLARLRHLFPGLENDLLRESDFSFEGAPGIFRAFGSSSRPYDPLSQIALRQKVAALCHQQLSRSRLFTWDSWILLEGETLPSDPVLRKALALARNAWHLPFRSTDRAVLELQRLLQESVNPDKAACMAALLAPQFWLGAAKRSDVGRRISLDLYLRVPTLAELDPLENGSQTALQYFDQLLADSRAKEGLWNNIRQWHEEWLGLRKIINPATEGMDRRTVGQNATNSYGGPFRFKVGTGSRARGLGVDRIEMKELSWSRGFNSAVNASCQDGVEQEFDPETFFTFYEHRNHTTGTWNFVGGWVNWSNPAAQTAFFGRLAAESGLPESVGRLLCGEVASASRPAWTPVGWEDTPQNWRRCHGLIFLPRSGAGKVEDAITVLDALFSATGAVAGDPGRVAEFNALLNDLTNLVSRIRIFRTSDWARIDHSGSNLASGSLTAANWWSSASSSLATLKSHMNTSTNTVFFEVGLQDVIHTLNTVTEAPRVNAYPFGNLSYFSNRPPAATSVRLPIYGFQESDRRHRRFAPSGWQTGLSKVRLWFTGQEVSVCNGAERFLASCFFRPQYPVNGATGGLTSGFALGTLWITSTEDTVDTDSLLNPLGLSAMRCGQPDAASLASVYDPTRPNQFYPRGARGNSYREFQGLLEGASATGTTSAERAVFSEISRQLEEEPYQLIERLVFDRMDYRQLLTASATYGTDCLEEYYQQQGLSLPVVPSRRCAAGSTVHRMTPGAPIPAGLLARVNPATPTSNPSFQGVPPSLMSVWQADGLASGGRQHQRVIPPRVASGIVGMPAFLSPVQNSARGISSRFFTRLLCDQPSFFDPDKVGADAIHRRYVSGRNHLKPECYNCHRNLDPLASALSWRFVNLARDVNNQGEGVAGDFFGELLAVSMIGGDTLVGIRNGGTAKGQGAFMGKAVEGIVELSQEVANSRKFAECVVSTTFTHVYGRPVQFADVKLFQELTDRFISPQFNQYRYLELLRTMVTSQSYQRQN
jgi:hypothetical protein